jgi:hypothetical protein
MVGGVWGEVVERDKDWDRFVTRQRHTVLFAGYRAACTGSTWAVPYSKWYSAGSCPPGFTVPFNASTVLPTCVAGSVFTTTGLASRNQKALAALLPTSSAT